MYELDGWLAPLTQSGCALRLEVNGDGNPSWFCGILPDASDADSHARFIDQRWLDNTVPALQFGDFNTKPGLKSE
ncbi:MAG: hypothetical protein P8L66_07830, partial [Rhodospirillaceae bacterium]|nr:hypothetical protein [Rhodospirillaceae bacterium]